MAFRNKDLSVIAYANGFTLWHYRTTDKMSDLLDGYFKDNVSDLMSIGDIFIINTVGEHAIKVITEIKDRKVKLGNL